MFEGMGADDSGFALKIVWAAPDAHRKTRAVQEIIFLAHRSLARGVRNRLAKVISVMGDNYRKTSSDVLQRNLVITGEDDEVIIPRRESIHLTPRTKTPH